MDMRRRTRGSDWNVQRALPEPGAMHGLFGGMFDGMFGGMFDEIAE